MRSHFKRELQFIPHRRVFLGISCVLVILAVIGLVVRGLVFGIEFQGGTTIDFHNTGEVTIDQMRSALSAAGETDPVVQTTQSESGSGFLVRSETTDPNVANDHAAKAGQSLGLPDKSYTVTTIGPDWGQDITRASAFAFGIAIVLIIAYVSLRYEFKMSITAVLALMHDLVITLVFMRGRRLLLRQMLLLRCLPLWVTRSTTRLLNLTVWTKTQNTCTTVYTLRTIKFATSQLTKLLCVLLIPPLHRWYRCVSCLSWVVKPLKTLHLLCS